MDETLAEDLAIGAEAEAVAAAEAGIAGRPHELTGAVSGGAPVDWGR